MRTENPAPSTAFGRLLREFKREGCNLLLVGRAPERVRRTARRRLLGSASERRYRLLVSAGGTLPSLPESEAFDAARKRTRSIECDVDARTAAAASSTTIADPRSTADRGPIAVDDLDALSERVRAEIASLERIDGGFGPGELRVSVDSLAPLLAATDEERLGSFLGELTSRVRIARGMGHYFLPVEYGSTTERAFRSHFDAVLEHRVANDGTPMERWHVPERDLTTRWIAI